MLQIIVWFLFLNWTLTNTPLFAKNSQIYINNSNLYLKLQPPPWHIHLDTQIHLKCNMPKWNLMILPLKPFTQFLSQLITVTPIKLIRTNTSSTSLSPLFSSYSTYEKISVDFTFKNITRSQPLIAASNITTLGWAPFHHT